jgi:hypothetical protein
MKSGFQKIFSFWRSLYSILALWSEEAHEQGPLTAAYRSIMIKARIHLDDWLNIELRGAWR